MALPARISLPPKMRVDASVERRELPETVSIVHVGQSAVVFSSNHDRAKVGSLLIVTNDSAGLMPGGISLRQQDFLSFRERIHRANQHGVPIVLNPRTFPSRATSFVDLSVGARKVAWSSLEEHHRELDQLVVPEATVNALSPKLVREKAPSFSRHALLGVVGLRELRTMLGAGPGTTPSGDDVIVGVLAGLRTLGLTPEATGLSHQISPLLNRTTVASAHYLRAAADNRFGEHVHQLISSLANGSPSGLTVRRASRWGATSGIDLLTGLVSTLASFHGNQASESAA